MKNIFTALVFGLASCAVGAKTCTWVGTAGGEIEIGGDGKRVIILFPET